ncbi:DUF3795 domain-containing protein [bacterium]|nr:DUF3795 domain-containing protein [bacterium]
MKEIIADETLVAFCGLYCGACKAYKKGKCPGCRETEKKDWCKIRKCNVDHSYASCADCVDFEDPAACRKLNRFWFKFFSIFVGYDMPGGVRLLKEIGPLAYAEQLAGAKSMWVKRR